MIRKHPYRVNAFFDRRYLLSSARAGLSYIIDLLDLNTDNKILLPSYIGINDKEGSGVFDPISAKKVGYEFYRLNKDLSIDMDDLCEKIKDSSIRAVLLIHYFGFVQCDLEKIVKICKKNNLYLIEDCAHAFMSKYNNKCVGKFGDVSFFSLHKYLPITDGGALVINNDKIKDPQITDHFISEKTLRLLYQYDMKLINQVRRKNYKFLSKKIEQISGLDILYKNLPSGIVPLNFPVIVKNKNRDDIYFKLLDKGIETTALYYRIIEQIDERQFPISHYVSDHILNLPIHQDITQKDIKYMTKELKEIMDE
jgi:dTDP-4-amino-4,6-dideoxygalactose transaminase